MTKLKRKKKQLKTRGEIKSISLTRDLGNKTSYKENK